MPSHDIGWRRLAVTRWAGLRSAISVRHSGNDVSVRKAAPDGGGGCSDQLRITLEGDRAADLAKGACSCRHQPHMVAIV